MAELSVAVISAVVVGVSWFSLSAVWKSTQSSTRGGTKPPTPVDRADLTPPRAPTPPKAQTAQF